MQQKDLLKLKEWFINYVSGYYKNNPKYDLTIKLKQEHTVRVCQEIIKLGKELNISVHDLILAETMALFHDIGRFEQYKLYGTFNDMKSENHAGLGLKQLAKYNTLSVCSKEEKLLIKKAIAYHNAAEVPENEGKKHVFFMRLLRDADKLDIWRVVINYYHDMNKQTNAAVELGLPNEPFCSEKIIKTLKENKIVRMQDMKTLNDFKLLQISWVFDLNFFPSFQAVKTRKYLEKIEATLPASNEIKEAVKHAYNYVDSNLGQQAQIVQ